MKSLADLKKLIMMICLCTLSVTCLCSCALSLPGKSGEDSAPDGSVKIYCFDREENTLSAYDHILNSNDAGSTASELIEEMKKTPENIEIKEVIRDFDVISCDVEGSQIVVTVDERYNLLEPTREILTRAAIVRTLGQIEGIDRIAIKVRGEDLTDSLGQPVGLMSVADFVDNPGDEINAYENKELALYFADIDGTGLVKATRTVEYNTSISLEKLTVEQLILGTEAKQLRSTINPQTKIINVTVKDGTCYVNLDSSFLVVPDGIRPEVMIYSIVDSLVELPGIQKVQFSVDGESDIKLADSLSLTDVYERNLDIVR